MKWEVSLPEAGDIIRVKHRFYYHYGIYIDDDTVVQFGLSEDAVHNAADVRVLCDGRSKNDDSVFSGRTEGNKIVFFDGEDSDTGEFLNIRIERAETFALWGKIVR